MSCPFGFSGTSSNVVKNATAAGVTLINLNEEQAKVYRDNLVAARDAIRSFINSENCHPIMVRLAWHDSGTFDVSKGGDANWPLAGGANGSIRFDEELGHGANAGLPKARLYLKKLKEKHHMLSWADLIQLASAEAIALAGGPVIQMRYGRQDADVCPREGNLPDALPPFKGEPDAASHLRNVFYRMGFGDQEIVALSGAHTLGRAFKERSGVTDHGYGSKGTKFTSDTQHAARADRQAGLGMPGGQSWTENWLSFDNSYFTAPRTASNQLLWLPTDEALRTDDSFKLFFARYKVSQSTFFDDYAEAHRKLSELGSRFMFPGGIRIVGGKL